jgi:hypothetical protein
MPLTLTRHTDIRMPIPEEESRFTALFVLDENVSPNVSSGPFAPVGNHR